MATSVRKAAKTKRSTRRKRVPKSKAGKSQQRRQQAVASRVERALQMERFQDAQGPDRMRALAEQSVAQTRAAYEQSKDALQNVLESWQKTFGAVGQGAVEFNRKMIDIADRRIANSFDIARRFAKAKNVGELLTIQQDYWRDAFGDLNAQTKDVRLRSTRLLATATAGRRGSRTHKSERSPQRAAKSSQR